MHEERYDVPEETAAAVGAVRARGGRVVAVGTTAVRTLESAATGPGGALVAGPGRTSIFIRPGHRFARRGRARHQLPPAAVDPAHAGLRLRPAGSGCSPPTATPWRRATGSSATATPCSSTGPGQFETRQAPGACPRSCRAVDRRAGRAVPRSCRRGQVSTPHVPERGILASCPVLRCARQPSPWSRRSSSPAGGPRPARSSCPRWASASLGEKVAVRVGISGETVRATLHGTVTLVRHHGRRTLPPGVELRLHGESLLAALLSGVGGARRAGRLPRAAPALSRRAAAARPPRRRGAAGPHPQRLRGRLRRGLERRRRRRRASCSACGSRFFGPVASAVVCWRRACGPADWQVGLQLGGSRRALRAWKAFTEAARRAHPAVS